MILQELRTFFASFCDALDFACEEGQRLWGDPERFPRELTRIVAGYLEGGITPGEDLEVHVVALRFFEERLLEPVTKMARGSEEQQDYLLRLIMGSINNKI